MQSAECRKLGPTLPEPSRARRNKGVGIHFHVRLEERRIPPHDDGERERTAVSRRVVPEASK